MDYSDHAHLPSGLYTTTGGWDYEFRAWHVLVVLLILLLLWCAYQMYSLGTQAFWDKTKAKWDCLRK